MYHQSTINVRVLEKRFCIHITREAFHDYNIRVLEEYLYIDVTCGAPQTQHAVYEPLG